MTPGHDQLHELNAHPQHGCPGGGVTVRVSADSELIVLRYEMAGQALRLPAPVALPAMRRADELWRHTCAELFVGYAGESSYREFNFSPSGQWAAYDFSAYRERMPVLPILPEPQIELIVHDQTVTLEVSLRAACMPISNGLTRKYGLTVVRESAAGEISYWALAHPRAVPDFHHRDGFVLTLD